MAAVHMNVRVLCKRSWESSGKSRLVVVTAPVEINLHTHKCEEENSLLYCSTPTVLSDLAPVSLLEMVTSAANETSFA